jgi:hypothetical protein
VWQVSVISFADAPLLGVGIVDRSGVMRTVRSMVQRQPGFSGDVRSDASADGIGPVGAGRLLRRASAGLGAVDYRNRRARNATGRGLCIHRFRKVRAVEGVGVEALLLPAVETVLIQQIGSVRR